MTRKQLIGRRVELTNVVIGGIVRDLRKDSKMTQNDICKAMGLEQSALSRVESGKQSLSAAQWVLFCQKIGVICSLTARVEQGMKP